VRLPETKIKAAILDTDLEIRQRAIRYFAYSTDLSVMPHVIQAVERFGRQDAYHLIGSARELPQTEETITWIIDELGNESNAKDLNYSYNLSMVLVRADPALLLQHESVILDSKSFLSNLRLPFSQRLQMLAWDEATCWKNLEEFCEEGKDKQYVNDVNLAYGNQIVEALARYGEECEAKVHALLSQKIDDYRHNPMKWMEPFAVRLAGEAQLDSTIPLLIAKLIDDGGDLLNEECGKALTRINTPAVLEAVADAHPDAPYHFRLYATEPLEHIHSDLAVEKCVQLLRQASDRGIQVNLGHALLSHFPKVGIEEVRNLLVERDFGSEGRGLRNNLVETCTIMGERFPEYDEWRAAEMTEKEEHRRQVKQLEGDPAGLMKFALEKLTGNKSKTPDAKPSGSPHSNKRLTVKSDSNARVGRNEPCPCGSGKKFKQCCLRKEGG